MGNFIYYVISYYLYMLVSTGVHAKSFDETQAATTTIKTQKGQIFDCVDFYKQPAFEHHLIKKLNYTVMRQSKPLSDQSRSLGFKALGCPFGTVPILRNSAQQRAIQSQANTPSRCWAIVRTILGDGSMQLYGGIGAVNIYKSKPKGNEWLSTSRIKVINGYETIEVGWMVNPNLYHDYEARLYTKYWNGTTECYNLDCQVFVQVSGDISLGLIAPNYSQIGPNQPKWTFNVTIAKHQDDKHWWVSLFTDNGAKRHDIGYYPGTAFTTLADNANQIEWGGEIVNPYKDWPYPQMGSGYAPRSYDVDYYAFFTNIMIMDQYLQNYEPEKTEKEFNCRFEYSVLDLGLRRSKEYPGRTIVFGGPDTV